ncbi:ryptide family R-Y-crosslinked RiPP peptide [Amygdalobacter indicium]|jgi:hypothetical protein|uniref:Ryptide family R-Y-crosslinked RiPP peptide n=1 Tax=Amygdalobacter indicium TaxID=3029272 RepID=A0ABY8C6S3_9FIRM|nr:ryptide family R-Y-crosslinked RiPP peptide [Amygdalobacter indicium]MCT7871198.1 ryptide family R-Y-crosslinked RiPP peptide [Lactobacillus crispatus]WEG34664.1 ryptide family R-Y-crosslinked RiPP peptide [Amygdalobacter indicium]WEG35028.1 ryptide family R-Y-crosslinked RiPP peptide [Amygdalobacter indicium]
MLIEFTKEELLQMKSIDELMEAAENNDCEFVPGEPIIRRRY